MSTSEVVVELDRCACPHCDRAEAQLRRLCNRFGAVLRVARVENDEATKDLAGWKTPIVYLNERLISTFSTPVQKWEDAIRERSSEALFTIAGEVVDLECLLKNESHGESHAACARECLARGEPVGLLTPNKQVFLLLADAEQRKTLIASAAREVSVEGAIFRKGGVQSIAVRSVKAGAAWPCGGQA